jgi:hypothetical protein
LPRQSPWTGPPFGDHSHRGAHREGGASPLIDQRRFPSRASRANRRLSPGSRDHEVSGHNRYRENFARHSRSPALLPRTRFQRHDFALKVPMATRLPSLPTPRKAHRRYRRARIPAGGGVKARDGPVLPGGENSSGDDRGEKHAVPPSPTRASHSVRMGMLLGRSDSSAIVGQMDRNIRREASGRAQAAASAFPSASSLSRSVSRNAPALGTFRARPCTRHAPPDISSAWRGYPHAARRAVTRNSSGASPREP